MRRCDPNADAIANQLMPVFDVREEHHIRVAASAAATMQAASAADLEDSWIVRTLFKARAFMMRAKPEAKRESLPFVAQMQRYGWGILADMPDTELIMGTVTQPWEANVHFRTVDGIDFASYLEPGYVKIVFTLRAEPLDDAHCIFHTETRAVATDESARKRFRRYWTMVWPGVILVRLALLPMVRTAAEKGL